MIATLIISSVFNLRSSDPGNLSGKALDMVFLLLQVLGRDKHGEVRVFNANILNLAIEPGYCM